MRSNIPYDQRVWQSVLVEYRKDKNRINEFNQKAIPTANGLSLRYKVKVYGKKPQDGYSMFICLHGGGG